MVKIFMLQNIYISNFCDFSRYRLILYLSVCVGVYMCIYVYIYILFFFFFLNKKCFLSTKLAYYNDFWRIMWHWRLK